MCSNRTILYRQILLALFAVLLLVRAAGATNLGTLFQGTFSLPYDAEWQGHTLHSGEYHFTLSSYSNSELLTIWDSQNKVVARLIPAGVANKETHHSFLKVLTVDNKHYVSALDLGYINRELDYYVPKTPARDRELLVSVETIPVTRNGR